MRGQLRKPLLLLITVFSLVVYCHAQVINTIAGTGASGYSGDGGQATSAQLHNPGEAVLDDSGNVFIADTYNSVVREIRATSGIISTVAGNGVAGYSGDGGQATAAELDLDDDICLDKSGNIYIADSYFCRIRKVNISTGIITTIAGNGVQGYSGDGGQATSAELYTPTGLCVDNTRNLLYIADEQNYVIRAINISTGIITTFAGNGIYGFSGDGGPAVLAEFRYPLEVRIDIAGNLYVSDNFDNRIREINYNTGVINTMAGNGTGGYTGDGGPATAASMHGPTGFDIDSLGNLAFADGNNNVIREIDSVTGIITTIAGNGHAGYSGDGGPPLLAKLNGPSSVSFDRQGNYYVADWFNNRIRKIKPCPPLAPVKNKITSDTVLCAGNSTTLNVSGTGEIEWYSSLNGGNYLDSGTSFTTGKLYADTVFYVQDSIHCGVSSRIAIPVKVNPKPNASITGNLSVCLGKSTTLFASGGGSYLWNTGDTLSDIIIAPIANTTYSVIVTKNKCKDTAVADVLVNAPPISVCCDSLILPGQSVQLTVTAGAAYLWTPATGLSCDTCQNPIASPTANTTYTVVLTSDSGCISSQTVSIEVTCGNVFVPDAFSPNGDGYNDVLYVRGPCITSMEFKVFDRWGNKVFESTEPTSGWDGKLNGLPLNPGTYVWMLEALMKDGSTLEKKGNVTLLR